MNYCWRIKLLLFCLFLTGTDVWSQGNNLRRKVFAIVAPSDSLSHEDTLRIDTLSLIPSSIQVKWMANPRGSTNALDTFGYKIDPVASTFIFNANQLHYNGLAKDSIEITYRVFPLLFPAIIKHKDIDLLKPDQYGAINPFKYTIEKPLIDPFKTEGLTKSGSISRGITFGSNQDLVVNSNLNLQVSGKLTDKIDILLSATDNTLPMQAQGNTQQLQEFDKVFIQINDKQSKLIAGDFQVSNGNDYFLKFNKKAQGGSFTTQFPFNPMQKDSSKLELLKISATAAISKGKFGNVIIHGTEGNQGPYMLTGAAGEQFVIVLSGSERVYIDGQLLVRGQDNDYIIDYNTGQVRFTAKQLITKDKRIEVQFQYITTSYTRSMLHSGIEFSKGDLKLRFNVYSEQDNKNNPLQQQLTDADKLILAKAGNNLTQALKPGVDSLPFNTMEVRYLKKDTTIGGLQYKGIYSYSTDSTKAHFRLQFSQVAKGNYIMINSAANGKVYQWIAPVGGIPQGNFEPVIALIAPNAHQLVTMAGDYKIDKHTNVTIETGLSNTNQNTYSSLDKQQDLGFATHLGVTDDRSISQWKMTTDVKYDYLQQNFNPIETFRSVEFQRDWNLVSPVLVGDENLLTAGITLSKPNFVSLAYHTNTLLQGSGYTGYRQLIAASILKNGYMLTLDGSLTNTASAQNTSFLRQKVKLTKKINRLSIGIIENQERNIWKTRGADSLLSSSAGFFEWTGFVANADTGKRKINLSYKQRTDYGAGLGTQLTNLKATTFAQELSLKMGVTALKNNQLFITTTYRDLQIKDTSLAKLKPDHLILGRIEHNYMANKGVIVLSTFFEIGSGQEVKQQFSYLQVPAGQGLYTWTDYNHDGIQQLNEFDIAVYKDQANFIRIYTPSSQTIPVFTNQFNETLTLRPMSIWANEKGFKKFLSLFYDQASYRIDKKTSDNNLDHDYNPFYNMKSDTLMRSLNSSFRNSLSYNQLNPIYGIDFNYQDIRSRILNTDGIDTRINLLKEMRVRLNFSRVVMFNLITSLGEKYSNSQFFNNRDFDVAIKTIEPRLSYQPGNVYRLTVLSKTVIKENQIGTGDEKSSQQTFGLEMKYSMPKRGNLTGKFNMIYMSYNGDPLSPVAYEMLEALHPGQNYTWSIGFQQTVSNNMTISLSYDGRKSQMSPIINTGTAQVRANF